MLSRLWRGDSKRQRLACQIQVAARKLHLLTYASKLRNKQLRHLEWGKVLWCPSPASCQRHPACSQQLVQPIPAAVSKPRLLTRHCKRRNCLLPDLGQDKQPCRRRWMAS